MNRKADKVAPFTKPFEGSSRDARYLGFFACFNRHQFFEAHEVLEQLWLPARHGPNGAFYKGLIQLAGAFVHVQHGRRGPAMALFKLAQANLQQFPAVHEGLHVGNVLQMIEDWARTVASTDPAAAPAALPRPDLQLPVPTCQ